MKKNKSLIRQFDLSFAGLKEGTHSFEYPLEQAFFDHYPSFEFVQKGEGMASISLEKKTNMLQLFFSITATIHCDCDRCGDALALPVSANDRLIVKFGDEGYEQTEEIMNLAEKEHKLNLMDLIYEFLYLNLPLKMVHEEGACNEESLARLNGFDDEEKGNDDEIDPRWEALKNIN